MSDDIFNAVYNKALDLLSRREHSSKEIREKLILRFDDIVIINKIENVIRHYSNGITLDLPFLLIMRTF